MKNKLFHVLVLGGAALLGSQQVRGDNLDATDLPLADKAPIFCTDDDACPKDASGKRQVKEGFECCWGTSCETIDAE